MKKETLLDIPPDEILEAELTLRKWMEVNGHEKWQLGGSCCRSFEEEVEDLRIALVKITQMNCNDKTDIVAMIAKIRRIARNSVPDYSERAKLLRKSS